MAAIIFIILLLIVITFLIADYLLLVRITDEDFGHIGARSKEEQEQSVRDWFYRDQDELH